MLFRSENGGKILAQRRDPYFNRDIFSFCSHQHTPPVLKDAGAGIIQGKDGIYIAWEIFADYANKGALIAKQVVNHAIGLILDKTFKSNMPSGGVVTLMKQPQFNRYINHLLYASPVKRGSGIEVIEDLIPLYNISAELIISEKINKIYDAKTKQEIKFNQDGSKLKFTVDKLECHKAIILEYQT